jgi:DNA-binding protein HU-beta
VNKAQLIDVVAQNLNVSRRVAGDAVDAVLAGITGAVIDGDRVSLTGFGTFETAHRPARTARNPRTGEQVRVAASTVPKFRAGQAFKDEVNGAKAKPARKAGKKTAAAAKKSAPARKAAAAATRATAAKKAPPAKKAAVKKAVAKATPAKKTATKSAARPMMKKVAAKAPATKTAAKKTATKKATAKKTTAKKR